jgi:peptidoglycan/LPS O-acetylase OafA/YrhL
MSSSSAIPASNQTDERFLPALSGLRLMAACLLVIDHFWLHAVGENTFAGSIVRSAGAFSVNIFFVLSGFLCTLQEEKSALSGWAFAKGRLRKVYPLFLFSQLLALPVLLLRIHAGDVSLTSAGLVLLSIPLLLQAWFPQTSLVWNAPSWSVSTVACFYMLWPALARRLRGLSSSLLLGLSAACVAFPLLVHLVWMLQDPDGVNGILRFDDVLAARHLRSNGWVGAFVQNPLFRLADFVLGITLCLLWKRGYRLQKKHGVLAFVWTLGMMLTLPALSYALVYTFYFLPLTIWLVMKAACRQSSLARILSRQVFVRLSRCAAEVFLLQFPLSYVYRLLLHYVLDTPLHSEAFHKEWRFALPFCIFVFVGAALCHRFITPGLNRLIAPRRAQPTAIANQGNIGLKALSLHLKTEAASPAIRPANALRSWPVNETPITIKASSITRV